MIYKELSKIIFFNSKIHCDWRRKISTNWKVISKKVAIRMEVKCFCCTTVVGTKSFRRSTSVLKLVEKHS